MAIMDMIRKFSGNKSETRSKFKEAQENLKIQQMIEERQKSSNRRELERYYKDKEEAQIKTELDKIRKKQQRDTWSGEGGILREKTTILKEDRPILKEKNIFIDHKSDIPFTKKGDMFFKW
jgi:hypothetical protein